MAHHLQRNAAVAVGERQFLGAEITIDMGARLMVKKRIVVIAHFADLG